MARAEGFPLTGREIYANTMLRLLGPGPHFHHGLLTPILRDRTPQMAKKAAIITTKTSAPNAVPSTPVDYSRHLDRWPHSWMGCDEDLQPGEKLVACFRPFLEDLSTSGRSPTTIRRHLNNLWLLGGEIIRDVNQTPALRKKSIDKILKEIVDDAGGPLIHGYSSEEEQRSFDSTCRKLHRFLSPPFRRTMRLVRRGMCGSLVGVFNPSVPWQAGRVPGLGWFSLEFPI